MASDDSGQDGTSRDDASQDDAAWRRLHPRMLAVFPLKQAGTLVPLLAVALIGGHGTGNWQMLAAVVPGAAVLMIGAAEWFTVRYRVSQDRVELRGGLLRRQQRSVRRDRIRTVDLRASPVHRLFGLSIVEIGTGSGTTKVGRLSLDAVSSVEAERLRHELLDRSPAAGHPTPCAEVRSAWAVLAAPPEPGTPVAQLQLSWLRFAPLTTSGLVAIAAIVGTTLKVTGDLGVDLVDAGTLRRASNQLSSLPLWLTSSILVASVLVVAAVGSLVIYLGAWWNYRLSREADDTLRLRRGLLTTRSLSIEQRRMRGAEVTEPLLLRLAGGARCAAVTTGLDAHTSSHGMLLPPAPVAQAHRVAAAALQLADPSAATGADLVRHPPAALRRRLTRVLLPAAGLVALAWWLHLAVPALAAAWPIAVLALPLALLLGADRYRNLGHALRPEYLVIGQGCLVRRRVALQRRGIIGWRLRQSPLQRAAGVITLDAVTAAGAGRYSLVDISPARAAYLVEQVNPGLLPTR
jgi:putative membrane protein